jgi:4-hydroxyphenylacetate 3-monooxygenase
MHAKLNIEVPQTSRNPPFTGAEYLESLRDGRTVYINGERVKDVTTHPGFRNSARSIARMYDALHAPETHKLMTTATDTGNGGWTHRAFQVPRSSEAMVAQRDAIAAWSRLSYGWMGRTPDFKAALINTLGGYPEYYGDFSDNARRWYRKAQESVLFMNHALVNPPVDRGRGADAVKDVCVRVQKETDAGIYVSGAKVVATGAAVSHWNFVGQTAASATDDDLSALMFLLPVGAPGCKLICRASYEEMAARHGSPFDYPLSSRFDENDAIFVLDNAFVPWEDVLIFRDIERIKTFYYGSGFLQGFTLQAGTRFATKLDFLAGLVARALKITGGDTFRGNQAMLGEIVALSQMFWALTDAMVGQPAAWRNDTLLPNLRAAVAYRAHAPAAYSKVREIVHKIVASALIYLPSSARDLTNPEIAPYLERYVRGSNGVGFRERIKVMKLLWDAVGSEFGGRHELYERNYAGNHEEIRLQALGVAERSGHMRHMSELVDTCLSEYDERGWLSPSWISEAASMG